VAEYARAEPAWLRTFLDLPHGIPSHDTLGDVFARLNPQAFERCFQEWMASMVQLSGGKLVAIDGKSLRRSFEHDWDKSGRAHRVSAFVQANHMVFAQIKTEGQGQELSAIEKLLEIPDLEWAVVTIDALGCQKEIARRSKAKRLASHIRGHWSVENHLHGQLDVSCREDERRIRQGHGAENSSRLCRMALNLLKNEESWKTDIAIERHNCGCDKDYLLKVLLA